MTTNAIVNDVVEWPEGEGGPTINHVLEAWLATPEHFTAVAATKCQVPEIRNPKPKIEKRDPKTNSRKPETEDRKSKTENRDPERETRNTKRHRRATTCRMVNPEQFTAVAVTKCEVLYQTLGEKRCVQAWQE